MYKAQNSNCNSSYFNYNYLKDTNEIQHLLKNNCTQRF